MCLVSECIKIDEMSHKICRHLALWMCTLPHIFPFLISGKFLGFRVFLDYFSVADYLWLPKFSLKNRFFFMENLQFYTKIVVDGSSRDVTAYRNLWTSLIQILITHRLKLTLPLITQCRWYWSTCDILVVQFIPRTVLDHVHVRNVEWIDGSDLKWTQVWHESMEGCNHQLCLF